MKSFWLILFIPLLCWSLAIAQESDTTKNQKRSQERIKNSEKKEIPEQKPEADISQEKPLEGFIDANGNGIDDRIEQQAGKKRKGYQQAKDRFIDTDGDGICDGEESAIGLKKLYRKRRGQPGNR